MSSSAAAGQAFGSNAYFVDTLFRSDNAKAEAYNGSTRREAGIILLRALQQPDLSSSDTSYLDRLIVARTGVSASEADKRVSDTFTTAKEASEAAGKGASSLSALGVRSTINLSVLRQFAAAIGGRQRDHVETI